MRLLSLLVLFGLIACGNEPEQDNPAITIPENPVHTFENFDQKISYCIGFDNGFAINEVYNGPRTSGKFSIVDLEAGMLDYLGDAELRIDLFAVDSILDLYLGENGTVNTDIVPMSDASYALGLMEGESLVRTLVAKGIDQKTDVAQLQKGLSNGIRNNESILKIQEVQMEVSSYFADINKQMGIQFLENNAKKEGVMVTESGLQYEIFEKGSGIQPYLTDSCIVHYTGRFIDGREFESTVPSGQPAGFTPMGVIKGWQEGLQLMREGASYRFYVPYELSYGEQGSGPIEPYSTLVFDIDLIRVIRFNG